MTDPLATWKKLHAAGERLLSTKLVAHFRKRDAAMLDTMGAVLTPAAWSLAFRADDERDKLIAAIGETLLGFIATGASRVLKQRRGPRKRKDAADVLDDFKLPARVESAVEAVWKDLTGQAYWTEIQKNYEASITDLLTDGIKEGLSGSKLAKSLRETMTGMSKVRAAAISRTETTLAYNSGHQASYSELAADGLIEGKAWLAVGDADTRQSHSEADGQEVGADEDFTIGSESAPYPGHWSLSAEERINCRCTTTAVFKGE
jgi:SPP1 gp7 family putative phage head morphogenesis protein